MKHLSENTRETKADKPEFNHHLPPFDHLSAGSKPEKASALVDMLVNQQPTIGIYSGSLLPTCSI